MFAMNEFHAADVHRALSTLLRELIDGAHEETAWVLNPGDQGLLTSLERLSAADASAPAPGGGPPIAAHVDHLRYGLELLNRWSRGEEPFAEANYSASWGRTSVTDTEWADLRDQLRREADHWRDAVQEPLQMDEAALTGMLASVTHLAYHLGAIRQVNRALRGPQARD
jgi:hypothetical protein